MMSSQDAQHPNCMLKWMGWMLTPMQAMVAVTVYSVSRLIPGLPRARVPGWATTSSAALRPPFTCGRAVLQLDRVFWKTPLADLR